MHGIIDYQYIEQLSDSSKRGVRGQINRGYSGGGSRYGYTSIPDTSITTRNGRPAGYTLEIDKAAAETVKLIFELYGVKGWSIIRIVNHLNETFQKEGIHKAPKGARWGISTVSGILRNEKYIGRFLWNKTSKLKNYLTGKEKIVINPQNEWVRTESEELRIINNDLWELVQFRLAENNRKSGGKYVKVKKLFSQHLLTPVAKCGQCGNSISIVSGGQYPKYGCSVNHRSGVSACTNALKIDKFILEEKILSALFEKLIDENSMAERLPEIYASLALHILDENNRETTAQMVEIEEKTKICSLQSSEGKRQALNQRWYYLSSIKMKQKKESSRIS